MKRLLDILLLSIFFLTSANAQGAWTSKTASIRGFGQRGSASCQIPSDALIAAHPTLPMGTRVNVVNLQNNKQVIVVIAGRIVASGQRIIDVSEAVAALLEMPLNTVSAVYIEVVRRSAEKN
jgi:rare lipoprotein A